MSSYPPPPNPYGYPPPQQPGYLPAAGQHYAGVGYMSPADAPRTPTSVKVISIIGIVLGGISLLNQGGGIAMFALMKQPGMDDTIVTWNLANSVLGTVLAALLLTASILALRLRPLGRRLLLIHAPIYLLWNVAAIAFGLAYLIPRQLEMTPLPAGQESVAKVAAYATLVLIGLICCVYPICVLIYMARGPVKAAFGEVTMTGASPGAPQPYYQQPGQWTGGQQ